MKGAKSAVGMELFDPAGELPRLEEDDEVKAIIANIGR